MSSYMKNNEPELDPYNVLGVPPTASDADINKAFKKLALKLHPDKQQQQKQQQPEGKKSKKSSSSTTINPEQTEEAFHQVQWAKSFLLDAEFAEQRRKYDAKRVSLQARRVADETRMASMSDKRRRMRDELQRQEQQASHHLKKRNEFAAPAHGSSSRIQVEEEEEGKRDRKQGQKKSSSSSKTTTAEENARLERLRRQGNEMREAYADRQEQAAADKSRTSRRERELYDYVPEDEDEQRQVRLKWSRKKMASSSSGSSVLTESSLIQLLKQHGFGEIERVEMLGNKGNAALVTFVSADSCRPCVDALIDSEEMRATFVGKRKEQEELDKAVAEKKKNTGHEPQQSSSSTVNRDAESVTDWKLRRAAEREELLRQVERDEEDVATATKTPVNNNHFKGQKRKATTAFPPPLPKNNSTDQMVLSPFELLQRAEIDILEKHGILSRQEMRAFQAKVL